MSRREALNLCVCATLSPLLIISGAVGSGKTKMAHLLAEALGWNQAGRFLAFGPGSESLEKDSQILAMKETDQDPAMILLDDANIYASADPLRGLTPLLDLVEWRLCITLQDAYAGNPVPANVLDRGFMLRLNPQTSAMPWRPAGKSAAAQESPVSLNVVLQDVLPQDADAVPATLVERMNQLRKAMAQYGITISRRALDDTWNYCGVMIAYLNDGTDPVEILDMAVAQRILPALLAFAPLEGLAHLADILGDMPACQALLNQPLPILI